MACRHNAAGTLALLLAWLAVPAFAQEAVFSVANLTVDATAKDAVTAKQMALADAQRRGLRAVLKRVVPYAAHANIPELPPEMVEAMVDSVSVRSEQNSTTRYLATLDVSFHPQAVRQLLQSHQIPFSDRQAPKILILPVALEGEALKPEGMEGWRQAWAALDVEHGLAPARLVQPRPSLTMQSLKAILGGDEEGFELLRNEYGGADLVLAVAGQTQDGRLVTRLFGADAVGPVNYGRSERVRDGDVKAAARSAAAIAYGIVEGRWKMTQVRSAALGPGVAEQVLGRRVAFQVEFSGLKDWQNIRARLMAIPGLQGLETDQLSPRGASISFHYPGELKQLAAALAQSGFLLEERGGSYLLRSQY